MITTGVTGQPWRASINGWGSVLPWGVGDALDWYIAADDRWHVPADEPTIRQHRVEGTAVVETRVRVPNGDVVQRVYSAADAGGITIVEIENESTLPVAVAFNRRDVLSERPITDLPVEGIDLPADAFVMPLGHAATVRVGVPHGAGRQGALPAGLPTSTQVVRGWLSLTERASRFVLPEGERSDGLASAITGIRCEITLGAIPRVADDPVAFTLALAELVRMGEDPDHWVPELVDAVERIGPLGGWDADSAIVAAGRVLTVAGERRARRDLERIAARRESTPRPADPPAGVRVVPWLETRFAAGPNLLPDGLPPSWLGHPIEAYGVPTGDASTVSFALRWHGERPAVLWEQTGDPVELTASVIAPGWSAGEVKGEALWPPPPGSAAGPPSGADDPPPEGTSFS